jgi:hypothetical protein
VVTDHVVLAPRSLIERSKQWWRLWRKGTGEEIMVKEGMGEMYCMYQLY